MPWGWVIPRAGRCFPVPLPEPIDVVAGARPDIAPEHRRPGLEAAHREDRRRRLPDQVHLRQPLRSCREQVAREVEREAAGQVGAADHDALGLLVGDEGAVGRPPAPADRDLAPGHEAPLPSTRPSRDASGMLAPKSGPETTSSAICTAKPSAVT